MKVNILPGIGVLEIEGTHHRTRIFTNVHEASPEDMEEAIKAAGDLVPDEKALESLRKFLTLQRKILPQPIIFLGARVIMNGWTNLQIVHAKLHDTYDKNGQKRKEKNWRLEITHLWAGLYIDPNKCFLSIERAYK